MDRDNIFNKIVQAYNSLTKSEVKVASYILKHKPQIRSMTISELAAACHVGEATMTRFCRALGYGGFNDFKLAVIQATSSAAEDSGANPHVLYGEVRAEDTIDEKCRKLCHIGTEALRETLMLMNPETVRLAVDLLCRANNVFCYGQGNSSIVAMDAWGRFASVTTKFHWIADSHMQATTASLLREDDVVLYFSFSGATRELVEIGEVLKTSRARLILVTRFPNSPGAAFADLTLICGANESPFQQGSIAAKIAQLFIIDVLFNEFCSRDLDMTIQNTERSLNATAPKLL